MSWPSAALMLPKAEASKGYTVMLYNLIRGLQRTTYFNFLHRTQFSLFRKKSFMLDEKF